MELHIVMDDHTSACFVKQRSTWCHVKKRKCWILCYQNWRWRSILTILGRSTLFQSTVFFWVFFY